MQGGWLLELLEPTGVMSDVQGFLEWLGNHLRIAGHYSEAVGFRREPMLHAGILTSESLRDEVFGRLVVLRARHEKQGTKTCWSGETEAAWQQIEARVSNQLFGFPGPLEGERRPARDLPKWSCRRGLSGVRGTRGNFAASSPRGAFPRSKAPFRRIWKRRGKQ